MALNVFHKSSRLPFPPGEVYDWHSRPGALQRLSPPWEQIELLESTGGIHDGARAVLEIRIGPAPVTWVAEHRNCIPGRQFSDIQVEGPFARNRACLDMLAAATGAPVVASATATGTSQGAALLAAPAGTGPRAPEPLAPPAPNPAMIAYAAAWADRVG